MHVLHVSQWYEREGLNWMQRKQILLMSHDWFLLEDRLLDDYEPAYWLEIMLDYFRRLFRIID